MAVRGDQGPQPGAVDEGDLGQVQSDLAGHGAGQHQQVVGTGQIALAAYCGADRPDETDDLLRLCLHRLLIGEFPLLRSLASLLATYHGAAELERGLDIP